MSDVHRDNPEASEAEIEAIQLAALMRPRDRGPLGALMRAHDPTAHEPRVSRECRDCGNPYTVPESQAHNHSKWYSLCGHCLSYEL
jgi:hypothetical protein